MQLPVPVWKGTAIYPSVELRAPTPDTIAATQEAVEHGLYRAVVAFLSGCISSFTAPGAEPVDDRKEIAALVRAMPYMSAEPVAIYALLEGDADDGIEGVYPCPRCGTKVVCEFVSDEEDTRDHIRLLPVTCLGWAGSVFDPAQVSRTITFRMGAAVKVAEQSAGGGDEVWAGEFEMRWPTLADCMQAEARLPGKASLRQQMEIYAIAVERIEQEQLTPGVLGSYAQTMIHAMSKQDLTRLGNEMQKWGMRNTVRKACPSCGKVWEPTVATSNFFVSALAS